ncbi:multidrug effflux MFS transporter [Micromonospora mirobrigensis]|uniref:multidrug effflux MFS transporter n=1 Tax=Micromonospora mirobrigensis TaxID=262898 RepID=UPI00159EFFDA|nr:multidrug effflux MFS transporter [Micromonospora mirobrigensis]
MTRPQQIGTRLPMEHPARPARKPSLAALVLLTGIGPFATDTYIAALPELRRSLHTTATVAQLTMTAFIVGVAAGQLLLGPVSDSRGRRRIVVASSVTFAVLSAVCAVAPNGAVLVAARLGQGIAAGSGVAVGRAMVTDAWRGADAAARFGTIASVTFLGPVLAPAAGGLILAHGTWRTIFVALTVLGAAMAVAVLVGLPETLPRERRHPSGPADAGARMLDLLRDWGFLRHIVVQCLATAGFFTYIGGSSFVLQTSLRISPGTYTIVFATNAAAMAVTAVLFRVLVRRYGAARLRTLGVVAATVAAAGLLVLALADPAGRLPLAAPWALLCLGVGGMGFVYPATTALAQEAGRRAAGTAAALQGGLSFLTGALVTPLTGLLGYDSLLPMALCMTVFFLAASAALLAARRSQAVHSGTS